MEEVERTAELALCVASDVVYRDPYNSRTGRDALSGYMADFQTGLPGAHFEITSVREHHNRTLAHWNLVLANGSVLHDGSSFALLDCEGKLAEITGFFEMPSP